MPKLIELKPEELVIRNKRGELSFDRVKLVPGINYQLTQEQTDKVVGHPDFPRYLGKGVEVIESEGEPKSEIVDPQANSQYPDLSAFSIAEAKKIISGSESNSPTQSLPVLERWLATEERVPVRRQIENRITAIKEGRG